MKESMTVPGGTWKILLRHYSIHSYS